MSSHQTQRHKRWESSPAPEPHSTPPPVSDRLCRRPAWRSSRSYSVHLRRPNSTDWSWRIISLGSLLYATAEDGSATEKWPLLSEFPNEKTGFSWKFLLLCRLGLGHSYEVCSEQRSLERWRWGKCQWSASSQGQQLSWSVWFRPHTGAAPVSPALSQERP